MVRHVFLKIFTLLTLSLTLFAQEKDALDSSFLEPGINTDLSQFFSKKAGRQLPFIKYSYGSFQGLNEVSLHFVPVQKGHNLENFVVEMHQELRPFRGRTPYSPLLHSKTQILDQKTGEKIYQLYHYLTKANVYLIYRSKICKMMVQKYRYYDHLFILSSKLGAYNNYILVSGPQGCWAPIHIAPALKNNMLLTEELKRILRKFSISL